MKQHLLFNLRALLMLCMIFVIGGGSLALAKEVTLTTADYTWSADNKQVEQTIDGVTFNFNGGTTAPKHYDDGLRTYEGCVITISSESVITKIDFTYTISNSGNLTLTSGEGTWNSSSKSWTGSANSIALKVGHSSGKSNGQVRITKIVVTTVEDNRTATTVTFGEDVDDQTFDVNLGETFEGKTATVSPAEAGNVTYSSDNTEVASVDENTGAITLGGIAGKATITASFAKTDTYKASSAKYYINVIDPNGPVFYESFNDNEGLGGNDGKWSGFSAQSTLKYDKSRWNVENGSGASRCVKIGTGDAKGSATTPAIDLSGDKYILTFKAGAWNAKDEKTTINVVISNGTLTYNGTSSSTQTIEMNKGEWTDYTMTIAGATNNATITFTAKVASNNRFFLDEVKIVEAQRPEPTASGDLTFKAQDSDGMYYATFSSSKDVIFPSDVEVDAVSVEGSTLNITELAKDDYFVKATSADGFDVVSNGYYVPANTGVLIKSLENSVTYYNPYEAATVTLPANQLKPAPAEGGVFTPETGYKYYKLAYNDYDAKTGLGFYWGAADGGAFSVKAGTAYLAVPEGSGAKAFTLDGGVVTGISSVNVESNRTKTIYNIAGQRVYDMTKSGLYIVDGKKVVVK